MQTAEDFSDRLADAHIRKLLAQALPADAAVAKDARQSLSVAGTVFIHYITALALDNAQRKKRSSVVTEDVLEAIREAELDALIEPLQAGLESLFFPQQPLLTV